VSRPLMLITAQRYFKHMAALSLGAAEQGLVGAMNAREGKPMGF